MSKSTENETIEQHLRVVGGLALTVDNDVVSSPGLVDVDLTLRLLERADQSKPQNILA